jgi:two-component system copper resistance phosphate regulon response regulator CusR
MRVLVIEDEPKAGDYLKKGLEESGFVVDVARNGVDGLHLALEESHDVIVLDVMLPGMDGWQVLQQLRGRKDTPVLFLTARDEIEDRVRGLELGADDYLIKPFAFVELLARVRTLARRGQARESDTLTIGDLEQGTTCGPAHRPDAARVCVAASACAAQRRSIKPHANRFICVGHELR